MAMSEHDLEKLLGGFAADTLTPDEQQQLYRVALQDQELFNLLADEQGLKDLLTDPVVRRRLLQALEKTRSTTDRSPASWLDWFRRPSGLAWAGGLAAAVFAVVQGTTIYQESLKQADRSVAIEGAPPNTQPASEPSVPQPASPPISEPRLKAPAATKSAGAPGQETRAAKAANQAAEVMAKSVEERAIVDSELDALREPSPATPHRSPPSNEDAPDSADQKGASASLPSRSVPTPTAVPATKEPTGQIGTALSARSLFYGETAESPTKLIPEEQERSHSAQQFERLEQKERLSRSSQMGHLTGSIKPLGIRYNLVTHGRTEPHEGGDVGTLQLTDSIDLIIEANQDGFFHVWGETGSQPPHLLFPLTEEDPIASRMIAYQRRRIPVLPVYRIITIHFSRTPFGTLANKDLVEMNRLPSGQLQESSASIGTSGSQDLSIFVANQDPSSAMLVVRIPIHQP